MPNFEHLIDRHGEWGVQAIIEQIERCEGIRGCAEVPLEDRWNAIMQSAS